MTNAARPILPRCKRHLRRWFCRAQSPCAATQRPTAKEFLPRLTNHAAIHPVPNDTLRTAPSLKAHRHETPRTH
jgi:hypothetical protein